MARQYDFGPFEDWGVVREVVVQAGLSAKIHTVQEFFVSGRPHLFKPGIKPHASIDSMRMNYICVQAFLEEHYGEWGVRVASKVFAEAPNAWWDDEGKRCWDYIRATWFEKAFTREMAIEFRKSKKRLDKAEKPC